MSKLKEHMHNTKIVLYWMCTFQLTLRIEKVGAIRTIKIQRVAKKKYSQESY